MSQRNGRAHGVPPPSTDGVGGKFRSTALLEITLHRHKTTEGTAPDTPETQIPDLCPLTPETVSLRPQNSGTPRRLHGMESKQLMACKYRGISVSQTDLIGEFIIFRNLILGFDPGACQIPK